MVIKFVLFFLFGLVACGNAANGQGNERIKSFDSAKKVLREMYRHWQMQDDAQNIAQTIYCQCRYTESAVDHKSCAYKPQQKKSARDYRIEWEHVVPASVFGRQFDEWANKKDYKRCAKKSGRQCAGLLNPAFRAMEGDMYNLYPAVGSVNAARSNYPMAEISEDSEVVFGTCDFKLSKQRVQPRAGVRGDIARVYLYMEWAYPEFLIIGNEANRKMFWQWADNDPVSNEEKVRAEAIMAIQGNCNPFVLQCL